MKFDSMINSNHDLKKNGYKILRKLHKLEKRSNLPKAYGPACPKGYFIVLSCKDLADILSDLYGNYGDQIVQRFLKKTNSFIDYLDTIAAAHTRIDSKILSCYLTSYTQFFNYIIDKRHLRFLPNDNFFTKWNAGCIMAYIAVWGNR